MNPLFGFVFLFLTIQNILTISEFPWYIGNFISDVEGGRTQIVRNGLFTYDMLKATVNYIVFYLFSLLSVYYLILKKGGSVSEAFLLGATICASVETAIHAMFSRAKNSHIPVLIYDVLIVGGFGFGISVYIWNNFRSLLSKYSIPLLITFLVTSAAYLYTIYKIEITPHKISKKVECIL